MKLKVNGFSFPWPASGIHIELDVEPDEATGEERLGPLTVTVRGGVARVMPDVNRNDWHNHAVLLAAEGDSVLFLWDQAVVGVPREDQVKSLRHCFGPAPMEGSVILDTDRFGPVLTDEVKQQSRTITGYDPRTKTVMVEENKPS